MVRDTGLRVTDVLAILARIEDPEELLRRAPKLEREDLRACLRYAEDRLRHPVTVAVPRSYRVLAAALTALCGAAYWLIAAATIESSGAMWSGQDMLIATLLGGGAAQVAWRSIGRWHPK
jgi:hypothetical protein